MNQITTAYSVKGCWETRQGGRNENQDACASMDTSYGFLILVCDGMGGGPAGRLASTTAIDSIAEFMANHAHSDDEQPESVLRQAIGYAHQRLLGLIEADSSRQGMGTTVAAVLLTTQSAILAHVGDTRIYQFRSHRRVFRTQDHSFVGEMVRNGTLTEEQARLSAQSNLITRALGSKDSSQVDIDIRSYKKGDRFMLCSDGIWGMRPEPELIRLTASSKPVPEIVGPLVADTDKKGFDEGGHHDNLTLALIEVGESSQPKSWYKSFIKKALLAMVPLCLAAFAYYLWPSHQPSAEDQPTVQAPEPELRNSNAGENESSQTADSMMTDSTVTDTAKVEIAEVVRVNESDSIEMPPLEEEEEETSE